MKIDFSTPPPRRLEPLGVYRVMSRSDEGAFHFVVILMGGDIECTCTGFRYQAKCHHIDEVRDVLLRRL